MFMPEPQQLGIDENNDLQIFLNMSEHYRVMIFVMTILTVYVQRFFLGRSCLFVW